MIQQLYAPFRHWSNNGSVWLISDTHFDDPDTIIMAPEWVTPAEQIEIINKLVYPNDTFICLGDVGNPEWVKKLRCKYKVLLLGTTIKSICMKMFSTRFTPVRFLSRKGFFCLMSLLTDCPGA